MDLAHEYKRMDIPGDQKETEGNDKTLFLPFLLPRLAMFNGENSSRLQFATKSLAHCWNLKVRLVFFETFVGYVRY